MRLSTGLHCVEPADIGQAWVDTRPDSTIVSFAIGEVHLYFDSTEILEQCLARIAEIIEFERQSVKP